MPIYEYRCANCGRRVTVFVQGFPESLTPTCDHCGSKELTRLFSSFTMGKGDWYKRKGVYEDILSDSQLVRAMRRNDPRALAEWNRRMTRGMEEPPGPEFDEMVGRLEAGEPIAKVAQKAKEELEGGAE